jgi:cell wall-associated NlpC family hydrolase
VEPLVGVTRYCKEARRERAPGEADCLTIIYYIFKQALGIDMPLTRIGNMPRVLSSYGEWKCLNITREEAQCGDLIFVKKKEKRILLSHVAMMVLDGSIFHCNKEANTAVIQGVEEFFNQYEQKLDSHQAIHYIDYRDQSKRAQEGGKLIKDGLDELQM